MPSPKRSKPGFLSRGPEIKLPKAPTQVLARLRSHSDRVKEEPSQGEPRRRARAPLRLRGAGSLRSSRAMVGLDIQPGVAVAVQVQPGGSLNVRQAASVPLDGKAMPEGEVGDEQLLTDALRELFRDGELGKRVRLGIANQRTVFRTLELPPLTDRKELAAAVRFQAEDQLPMPMSNAVLDFHLLGTFETPEGLRQRVAVVAAQKDMVERLTSAVRAAGLRPEGVDLSAFALIRGLYRRGDGEGGQVLYLHVGGLTNIAIAEGTTCRFTRVTIGGLEALADRVANRLDVPLERARAILAGGGAALAQTPGRPSGEEVEDVEAVAPIVEQGVREIAAEVRNSLEFHSSQQAGPTVSEVIVSGPALALDGFLETLKSDLGVKVTPRTVTLANGAAEGIDPLNLAIAAGLTTEEAHK